MALNWTSEQVLALAPDAGGAKRGKALATVSKRPLLGQCEQAVWGECKGSGKNPYRTIIDLSEPAFRCSCPSRKFPCKHALGLFLLLAEQADLFSDRTIPDWGAEWLAKRAQTSEQKEAKQAIKAQKRQNIDPTAQAKRVEKRAAKVDAGLVDLSLWLEDIVRQGLANLPSQPYSFWDQAAARLVDAQAPGLARRVKALSGIPNSGQGWPERLLQGLGQLHLLVQGYQRIADFEPQMQAELRSQVGWPQNQDDLKARAAQGDPLVTSLADLWYVLGKTVTEEDKLKVQRTWLWGYQTQQATLMLSFAHGHQPLDVSLVPGSCFSGQLIFYPGTGVRRSLVNAREGTASILPDPALGFERAEGATARYAQALSENPWLLQFPLVLRQMWPHYSSDHPIYTWWLQDEAGEGLPLSCSLDQGWKLMALSGGHPITVFGEWDGQTLRPLSFWDSAQFLTLG